MKKRIFATVCALCCVFALLFVFVGCNSAFVLKDSVVADRYAGTAVKNETISGDESNAEQNQPALDQCYNVGSMVCYAHDENNCADFRNYLQCIGKNNAVNFLLFNVDGGLSCVGKDYCLKDVCYGFSSVVNQDAFDKDTYVFDMPYEICGSFATQKVCSNSGTSHGGHNSHSHHGNTERNDCFSVEYFCYSGESCFTKEDIVFVKASDCNMSHANCADNCSVCEHNSADCAQNCSLCAQNHSNCDNKHANCNHNYSNCGHSHSGWHGQNSTDGCVYEIYANGEFLGKIKICCGNGQSADTVLKSLRDCMVIVSNLEK